MTEQMLRQYTVLVEYLGKTLGPDYEVVLHEILPENSRVAAIANGSISGRSVGAPITNAALRMIMQKQYETSDYNLNYTGQLANGKTIRSSTMFIKDSGKLVGLLCINFDDSRFHEISDAILKLIHPDDFVHHHYFPVDAPGQAADAAAASRAGSRGAFPVRHERADGGAVRHSHEVGQRSARPADAGGAHADHRTALRPGHVRAARRGAVHGTQAGMFAGEHLPVYQESQIADRIGLRQKRGHFMSRGAEKTRVPLLMRDRSFYHTFLILAGTLILEQAVVLSVNLADNLMIGSYNETALAAVAAVNQIVFVVQQVIYGVTNGVIVLSSQYWGKQQTAPIRRLVCLGLRLEAALSMLFFAVVSLWPAQCVGLFVTDAAIIAEGVRYLRVIRFTFPFFAVTTVLLGAMRSVETVSLALKVSVVSLVTNCVINYILIFGRFGAPELGVVGAAIGTLAARTLECGIVCVYVFCRDRKLQLRAAELGRSDPALRGDYFRTSVPIVLQAAMWGVLNAIQTAILGHMTASAVAAYSISSTAFLLLKVTSVGACTAASIMVGKQIGSGGKQLRTMVYTMQLLFVGLGAALGIVLFFLRIPLLRVYRISDETRYLANAFFLIQSVVLLTMSYQMPTNAGILRGGGDTRFALVLDLISFWAIVIPLSYLAAFRWHASPIVVVMLLNSDQVFKCIPAFLRVNRFRWVHSLTREA